MRHSFTWTVVIALAAVACGSDDSNPADSAMDAVAGNAAAGKPSASGGAVQSNAGGTPAALAGAGGIAAAGTPGSSESLGGAPVIGVGGSVIVADAGAPSTGGIPTTSALATGGASTTDVAATGGVATTGGTSGELGTSGAGGLVATSGASTGAAAGSCAVAYYRDVDGDTWGAGESSCTGGAGWVTRTGDCHDGNANVFPEQTTTFAESYLANNGAQSFDYNCDGSETIAGGTQVSTGACETAGLGNACSGDGYLPVEPARSGTNANQLCGSMRYLVCARSQQVCIGAVSTDGTYEAARCK